MVGRVKTNLSSAVGNNVSYTKTIQGQDTVKFAGENARSNNH